MMVIRTTHLMVVGKGGGAMPIRHKNIVYVRDIAPIGGVLRLMYMS